MAYIRPGGGDSEIIITPTDLQDRSTLFSRASQDLLDLESTLNTDANNLINEMSSVLDQSPDALQRFFNRWRTALLDLSDSYDTIGTNLQLVAGGAQTWDTNIANQFDGGNGVRHGNMRIQ